jgi:capsular polysaccharide biosynthesis protein
MELRQFWRIIKRRWLLIILPATIVLTVLIITYSPPGQLYNAGIRFIASQEPSALADESDEERLANWKSSEYAVNTLADWVRGGQFAELVSQNLAADDISVPPGDIQGGVASDSTRSMMTLSINYGDATTLDQIMKAAAIVLIQENYQGLPQLGGESADLVQLDQPVVNAIPPGLSKQLDLPFRLGLAIAAGFGLAFLVEYLDPTIRDRNDLSKLGISIIGEIPKR